MTPASLDALQAHPTPGGRRRRPTALGALRAACGIVVAVALASASGGASAAATSGSAATHGGVYKTSVEIPVPPGPGAPAVSLQYNSSAGLGVAGVGWDLSVGWPTLIARDTRFGTPVWNAEAPWVWGDRPLVSRTTCTTAQPCSFRTAPDSLANVTVDLDPTTPSATVALPSGVELKYAPIRYDGSTYPAAPPGSGTNVFGFVLVRAKTQNGYLTCFNHTHHVANNDDGRAPVLSKILYGPALKDCGNPPAENLTHRIEFAYADSLTRGYFAPMSYRFGAPVSLNNLLTKVSVYAADLRPGVSAPAAQGAYLLEHEPANNVETRLPRLAQVIQESPPRGPQTTTQSRVIRRFAYGERALAYGDARLLDLGPDTHWTMTSLSTTETRPVRQPLINNPYGLFGGGRDQNHPHAPPASAVTAHSSLMDVNGDGLLDTVVSDERGAQATDDVACGQQSTKEEWATYENCDNPGTPLHSRPAQQLAYINEGIVGANESSDVYGALKSTKVILKTGAKLETDHPPGQSSWIWLEGRGKTRAGLPASVTSPEIRSGVKCTVLPTDDARKWPYLPDGSFGGSEGSIGLRLADYAAAASAALSFNPFDSIAALIAAVKGGYIPKHSVSAGLSNWLDWNGDGVPDWVVTPGMIVGFDQVPCDPKFPTTSAGAVDTAWYVAPGSADPKVDARITEYSARRVAGPPGPVPLPLTFSVDSAQAAEWGLTIPFGSVLAAAATAVGAPGAALQSAPEILGSSLAPRDAAGWSSGVSVNALPATLSATTSLYRLASTRGDATPANLARAGADFISSAFGVSLDLTLKSGGRRTRSQSRAEVVDFNADGLPDYLLYDSVRNPADGLAGALRLFLNDGNGGFSGPFRVDSGHGYSSLPDVEAIAKAADEAVVRAATAQAAALSCFGAHLLPAIEPFSIAAKVAAVGLSCGPLIGLVADVSKKVHEAADEADPFLQASTDALPGDKGHAMEARFFGSAAVVAGATAIVSGGAALAAGTAARNAAKTAKLIEHTLRQLAYPSRLNMLNKGGSYTEGAWIGSKAGGMSAQTGGLLDLNGDSLPDYVVTRDREKRDHKKDCADDEWAVFWGTGSAGLASGRGFAVSPACVKVPDSPAKVKAHGYATLPLQVDFSVANDGPAVSEYRAFTIVTLLDWNQDGRPDIVIADTEQWSPNDIHGQWRIYLNKGRGFDATPLVLPSVTAYRPGVIPAAVFGHTNALDTPNENLHVPTPGLKSGWAIADKSSSSQVDAGFLDVDGDGTADVARRVRHAGGGGILYWSRAGNAPQDLLTEDRDPIAGSRTLVKYLPASRFQWPNGTPDGNSPPGGHRSAAGMPAYLVARVTSEPLLGRADRRTAVGYDYKDPHFDAFTRSFAGFGRVAEQALDAETGKPVTLATSTVSFSSQREHGRGGPTLSRVAEQSTGAPVTETLTGYADAGPTASAASKRSEAYFSAPNDTITVEFPHELSRGAVFDVGFDGLRPLASRADRTAPEPETSASAAPPKPLKADPDLPTGGGMVFDAGQWIAFRSPHRQSHQIGGVLANLTVEAWLRPAAATDRGTVARLGDAYELTVEPSGLVAFAVNGAGGWTRLVGGRLEEDRWSHVAASYDGSKLRIFVNGVAKGEVPASGNLPAAGRLRVGCAYDASTQRDVACYRGAIGELRVYAEAFRSPARITRTRTDYRVDPAASSFGLPYATWDFGDLATASDDVYEQLTYAAPHAGGSVRDAVATKARRELRSDGTLGGWLGYSETRYDGRSLGEVVAGNPSSNSLYSGRVPALSPPVADTTTQTRYTASGCPGVATETEDPDGAITKKRFDATCTFVLETTNALGHTTKSEYYGVGGSDYADRSLAGRYGQLKASTDANGGTTRTGYDEWGRPTSVYGPYHTRTDPEKGTEYRDARCEDKNQATVPCSEARARLAEPPRTKVSTWDELHGTYRVVYTFGDGQVQARAVEKGNEAWVVSGTSDFDSLGRQIRSYKPRFAACPDPGMWCDPESANDPLRTASRVQTAYDERGRVIRAYGPKVPRCDVSARDPLGALACDKVAPNGSFTRFEYPSPGVTRTVDARGVPSVVRRDVRGRTAAVEEYTRASTTPYSVADYTYDRDGRVTAVTDSAGNTISTTYDALGRKTESTDPDLGTWRYEYDRNGRLVRQRDAAGQLVEHAYDPLGRVVRTEYRSKPQVDPDFRRYMFDGGSADSDASSPIDLGTPFGRWRKGPHFINQERFYAADYAWEEVELSPLALSVGDGDNGVAQLALPFAFALTPNHSWSQPPVFAAPNLIGTGTTAYISTNGKIRFDSGGASDAAPPSVESKEGPVQSAERGLYPLFADLTMGSDTERIGLSAAVVGTPPNRRQIIEWEGAFAADPTATVQFRVVLYERTSEVRYLYRELPWLGAGDAFIGLQNHNSQTNETVRIDLPTEEKARPAIESATALTSLHVFPNNVLQFNDGVTYAGLLLPPRGSASLEVNLVDARAAALSFRHSWSTRCGNYPRGSCPVDEMRVEYQAEDATSPTTLLSHFDLTARESLNAGVQGMDTAPVVSASLPPDLMGKKVKLFFRFDEVDGLSGWTERRYGWLVDDIRVSKTTSTTEEVVKREYDSSELASDYARSQPIVDLTFDVPGRIEDRSPSRADVHPMGVEPTPGMSGRGIRLDGSSSSSVNVDVGRITPLQRELTVEAWVKPGDGAVGPIVQQRETFGLKRDATGALRCWVRAGGIMTDASSGTRIPSDVWTHVAMTYDGTNVRCYVNGAEAGKAAAPQAAQALDWSGDPIFVGYGPYEGSLVGAFDEVRVFAKVRTDQELLADAVSPLRPGPPRGNVLDLRFSDPGHAERDSSGAKNDAVHVSAVEAPGMQGNALDLSTNPTGQVVVVPSSPSLQSTLLTAEVWAKTTTRQDRLLVGKWNPPDPGWRLSMNRLSGQARFEVITVKPNPGTWSVWTGDTRGQPATGKWSCGATPGAAGVRRKWVAPFSGPVTFTTERGAKWDTVLVVADDSGNELACDDNSKGQQSEVSVQVQQGATYEVVVTGNGPAEGVFTVGVEGLPTASSEFVTLEKVNDSRWHHIAATFDGKALRVYIDGKRALRTCVAEEGAGPVSCAGLPPSKCSDEIRRVKVGETEVEYGNATCAVGSIANLEPVLVGAYDPNGDSLEGMADEVRVSNYVKRDHEVAASARPASAYTFALGREVAVHNSFASAMTRYDLIGRPVSTQKDISHLHWRGGFPVGKYTAYVSRATFDNLGRATSNRYPDGEVAVGDFDVAGTQTGLTGHGDFFGPDHVYGSQTYLRGVDVTATGRVERIAYGNGVTTRLGYDDTPNPNGSFNEFLATQTTQRGATTLQDQSFEYDPVGNLRTRRDTATALHGAGLESAYTYDDLSRLETFETKLGGNVAASGSYSYDALGNLRTKEGAGLSYTGAAGCGSTLPQSLPHAVRSVTTAGVTTEYCYDANGSVAEIRSGGTATKLDHNARGKLRWLQGPNGEFFFHHDGDGQRIHKIGPAGQTTEVSPSYRLTPKGVEKYYFAGGRRIARRTGVKPADVSWYHADRLGGTNLMTGADGAELQDAYSEYTPFGRALDVSANNTDGAYKGAQTPDVGVKRSGGYQFTGKELDETGLYDYGARYYDPAIGRFIEADTVLPGEFPQALNRYSYVYNNTLGFVDPTGHAPELFPTDQVSDPPLISLESVDAAISNASEWISFPESVTLWRQEKAFGFKAPSDHALEHWWIETPNNEFGVGSIHAEWGTDPPTWWQDIPRGVLQGVDPRDTKITSHVAFGREVPDRGKIGGKSLEPRPGFYVTPVYGASGFVRRVDSFAKYGQPVGKMWFDNNCQTFALEVLQAAGAVDLPERFTISRSTSILLPKLRANEGDAAGREPGPGLRHPLSGRLLPARWQ